MVVADGPTYVDALDQAAAQVGGGAWGAAVATYVPTGPLTSKWPTLPTEVARPEPY